MHRNTRLVVTIWLVALLLAACVVPPTTVEQVHPSDTPAELSPTAIPSQITPPTETAPPPTAEPTETEIPVATVEPPIPPAGPTLEPLPAGQELVFMRVEMFDAQAGWATGGLAGNNDHLFTTRDGGNTWRDATPPQPGEPGTLAIAAFFRDASTAWATFFGEKMDVLFPPWPVVWRTNDAGQSWQVSQLLDTSGLDQFWNTALYFADPQHGWLLTHVGAGMSHDYVTIYRSTDGGINWERLLDPYNDGQIQGCGKTGMLFVDNQVGWLTGDCYGVMAGVFLNRTEDGGVTWTWIDLPAPLEQPLLYDVNTWAACGSYDLHFFDPQSAFLGVRCTQYSPDSPDPTFTYYMYTTQDGGTTWSSQPYPGGTLLFVDPLNGWALSREVYQTTDGGVTWTLVNNVHWDARFNFISPQLGWAASYTDTEYALVGTADGGTHWFMLHPIVTP